MRAAKLKLKLANRPLGTEAYARVRAVSIDLALNASNRIEVLFEDGDGGFSDTHPPAIGADLEVDLAWEDAPGPALAKGKVTAFGGRFSEEGTLLRLVAHGPRHALQHGTLTAAYQKASAGDLMSQASQKHWVSVSASQARLRAPYALVANRPVARLLEEQAARAGLVIREDGDRLSVAPLTLSGPAVPLTFGVELQDFRAEANTFAQVAKVVVFGVDPANRRSIKGEATETHAYGLVGRDLSGAAAAKKAFGEAVLEVGDCPVRSAEEAQALAKAMFNDRLFQFVTASGRAFGHPSLKAGGLAEIREMGKRLSGVYLLTRVQHRYTPEDGFSTHFEACRPALSRGV